MAFKVPTFNLWCQVWRPNEAGNEYTSVGYSKCALRGPESTMEAGLNTPPSQVLLPKGSDVRSITLSEFSIPDVIDIAGQGAEVFFEVFWVADKGAGYANEYRIVGGATRNRFGESVNGLRRTNVALQPPLGYTPLPILTPNGVWPSWL